MSTESLCAACRKRPALRTGDLSSSWDTCELCTGLAVQAFIDRSHADEVEATIRSNQPQELLPHQIAAEIVRTHTRFVGRKRQALEDVIESLLTG